MKYVIVIVRVLLGLMFAVFGSNAFLHFIPMPEMHGQAGAFMTALASSGYLYVIAVLQVLGGLCLLLGARFVPLGLTLLGPVIVNIVLYHLFLDPQGFRLRSFGKSFGAQWLEIAGFTPTKVRVGRRGGDVEVVEIHYVPGVGDRHLPGSKLGETLGVDERYLIAAYGGLSNVQLAAVLERYRAGG